MRIVVLSLIAASLAAGATAQVPRGFRPPSEDSRRAASDPALSADYFNSGLKALQAKNYEVAAAVFKDILRANRSHPQANLLMGVAQMGMENWTEARPYLEEAVKRGPKEPDPKSRLGVVYVKLGEIAEANEQRAALVKMSEACKNACRNASFIADGINMIDMALLLAPAAAQ